MANEDDMPDVKMIPNCGKEECDETSHQVPYIKQSLLDELRKDVLSLLYQISNSPVGSFGTWTGYLAQLDCKRIKSLIERIDK